MRGYFGGISGVVFRTGSVFGMEALMGEESRPLSLTRKKFHLNVNHYRFYSDFRHGVELYLSDLRKAKPTRRPSAKFRQDVRENLCEAGLKVVANLAAISGDAAQAVVPEMSFDEQSPTPVPHAWPFSPT